MNKKGGAAHDGPVAYLGRYPFRSGVTCADFDSEGELMVRSYLPTPSAI